MIIYVKLIKNILPNVLKKIFCKKFEIPGNFLSNLKKIFKNWCEKWKIFDEKDSKGILMYIFDFENMKEIEKYYSDFLKTELDNYYKELKKISILNSEKIINLGFEYGINTDCDYSEIINDLIIIKKIELLISLENEINGKDLSSKKKGNEDEPKIQRILKSIQDMNNLNNNNKNFNNNDNIDNIKDEINISNIDDDIDGEPI